MTDLEVELQSQLEDLNRYCDQLFHRVESLESNAKAFERSLIYRDRRIATLETDLTYERRENGRLFERIERAQVISDRMQEIFEKYKN